MIRPAMIVALYIAVGTLFTIAGYRLALGGSILPAAGQSGDGPIIFVSIALNTALAFAAAGTIVAMMIPSGVTFLVAAFVSLVSAALIGIGMTLWFPGLTHIYSVIMAAGGVVCAGAADALGLLKDRDGKS